MSTSGSHQDLRRALDTALHLPRSVARSAAIETVVQQADAAGDDLTARDARLALVSSYSMGGEPLKRFVPFAWLLQRYDADPTFFDENSRDELLWQFKGVTLAGLGHPGVSLTQIESGLADMERHYLAAGQGLAPYLGVRYHFDAHVHGVAASEESYLAWTRAPRTYLSDCEGCEPTSRVAHLNGMSRWSDAVSEAMVVLQRERNACVEQPQQMITYAMEPLLMTGDAERAAWEHLRAIRLLRPLPGGVEYWARHVLVLARSGRLVRGLDLLEERLHEVDDPPEPDNAMWLAAAGARLLTALAEAGHGDVVVTPRRGEASAGGTVVEVGERLTRVARDLAVQFDARNGTGTIGAGVEKWLSATDLPDLPLDEVATRRRLGGSGSRGPVVSGKDPGPALAEQSLAEQALSEQALAEPLEEQGLTAISEAFRASRDSGSRAQHRASLAAWRAFRAANPEFEAGSGSEAVPAARLDAALALAELAEPGDADDSPVEAGRFDDLRQAAARLREIGDIESARIYEMSLLWRRLQAKVAGREQIEAELEALRLEAQDASPGERGSLADGALQVMAALGQGDEGFGERWTAAVSEALALMRQGDPETMTPRQRASLARLMMFDSARQEPEAKLAQLRAALALVRPGERAFERANLGMQLASEAADTGDFASAAQLLDEAIADSQIAQEPRQEAELWGMLGRTRNLTEQPQEAVTAFTRAGVLLAENDAPVPVLASIRQDLVYALRAVGRSLEAAELAESALHQLAEYEREYERERGAEPDADEKDSLQRQLGTLAYAAAAAALDLGERAHAAELARRSAAWHASTGWVGAEAEAQLLVAQTTEDDAEELAGSRRAAVLYDMEGRWQSAARSRRLSLMATLSVEGPEAALAGVESARAALHQATPEPGREQALAWEHLVLTEQAARVLVAASRLDQALASLEGLDPAYADLGDIQSVGDVVVLRAEILIGLDRAEEALASMTEQAQQAVDAGDAQGARRFGGELARMLDDLGRPEEAETAWQRYSGQ